VLTCSRGTTLLSAMPLSHQGYVFIPSSLVTEDVPGQVYSGHTSVAISVGGSGRIFGGSFASGSHLARTLWTTAARLLVSIAAFVVLVPVCHRMAHVSNGGRFLKIGRVERENSRAK
jgi:hypothetical protein